jgi:hypothetical protein
MKTNLNRIRNFAIKRCKFFLIIILTGILTLTAYPQADSIKVEKPKLSALYMGMGAGLCNKGFGDEISLVITTDNNWGGSVRYYNNAVRAKNKPDDFSAGIINLFTLSGLPVDIVKELSFCVVKEFPTKAPLVRFGIEAGPTLVWYRLANFTASGDGFFGSNYDINYTGNSSIGFSLRLKSEFPLIRFGGLEVAAYANVNEFYSVAGVQFVLNLGLLRESIHY